MVRSLFGIDEKNRPLLIALSAAFVLLTVNLSALTDLIFHPEIPYFDKEHLIVGGFSGLSTAILLAGILTYTRSLRKSLRERERSEEAFKAAMTQAEQEKNTSEAILAAIGDGISVQDRSFRILFQNRAHKQLVGDHKGELCYRSYENQDSICRDCPVAQAFQDGQIHTIERTVSSDAGTRHFEIAAFPLRNRDGAIVAGIEAVRDITARKQAEEALRMSEERYKKLSQEFDALLNAIPDNLTLQSPDLKVLWANRGAAQGLGKDASELVGRSCYELWRGRSVPCDPCPVRKSFMTGSENNETVHSPDGRVWDLRTFPVKDDGGKVTGVIELARDITRQQRLERQLFLSQKMESVGLLAGGIAHDFNNILTAIIGYGNLALMNSDLDQASRASIGQMLAAAERAADLTKGLLAFSRRQILHPQPVDVNGVIRKIEQLLHRIIGEDIELRTALTEQNATAIADAGQIEQIFMNLATNARDAMPEGGRIDVATAIVPMDETYINAHGFGKEGTYVRIDFTDTGVGMDEQVREHVFEPFFTTKEVGKGTGLGLAIVYGIVKQHNGFINCFSAPGQGAAFRIYLPVAHAPAAQEVAALPQAVSGGSETILLAEDDDAVRSVGKAVLEKFGYSVIEAVDGEDALEQIRRHGGSIRIAVLDVIMPKMNGREVYRQALRLRPDFKAIFMSGYAGDMVHRKGVLEEGMLFLAKPVSPQRLLGAVRDVLEGK